MDPTVIIANIPVYIKGAGFLKNLSRFEKKLLRPFINQGSVISRDTKPYTLNTRIIQDNGKGNNKPFPAQLINKIKTQLACPRDHAFNKEAERRLKNFFYSDPNQFKKFTDIFISTGDDSKVVPSQDFFFIFNQESRNGYVFLHKRCRGKTSSAIALSFLKLLFAMLTAEAGGIMLHASSIVEKGDGYIFSGPGNSGKSTTAKMGGFNRILSDDVTLIRRFNNAYAIFPHPWWGKKKIECNMDTGYSQSPVPLKALFFIKKARKTALRKIRLKEALFQLRYNNWVSGMLYFHGLVSQLKSIYLFSLALSNHLPIFELRIKKGREFKEEFRSLLYRHLGRNA